MSQKNPIIAVTGSSGAGTTTTTNAFSHIFRAQGIDAAFVEGDHEPGDDCDLGRRAFAGDDTGDRRLVDGLAMGESDQRDRDDCVSHVPRCAPQGFHRRQKPPQRAALAHVERAADGFDGRDCALGDRKVLSFIDSSTRSRYLRVKPLPSGNQVLPN